jgi:hypothetical protein
MTQTHDDRVAAHQPGMCAAYGCPLHGTMSNATGGSDDWWCSYHFGKEAGDLQAVTSALNRHRWLADVRSAVLELHPARGEEFRHKTFDWIRKTLAAQGRDDLQWAGFPENTRQWSNRITAALDKLIAVEFTKPVQRPLNDSAETWTKASSLFPSWA